MSKVKDVLRVLWTERKAEIALLTAAVALAREIQTAVGH